MTDKKRISPNLLDRAVAAVSYKAGVNRMRAKAAWHLLSRPSAYASPGPVKSRGGMKKGTLFNWVVSKLSRWNEAQERETVSGRAEDLTANHPHAASTIDSMTTNVVGTGLNPQSKPKWRLLGISEKQAAAFAENAEWVYGTWCRHADLGNRLHFQDIQFQAAYSFLMNGEYVILPTMRKAEAKPGESAVRLALQTLSPVRMATPHDYMSKENIRDGVDLGPNSEPKGYYIATPKSGRMGRLLTSKDFTYYPAWQGHRPGVLHSYHAAAKSPDRVRGISVLAPAMKFFRDLSDYLDFELVGNIVASSFPLFIESANPYEITGQLPTDSNNYSGDTTRYQEFEPGQVMYGSPGQKPHVLKNERPGNTFAAFVETILRGVGASVGMPYEVVAKDFSKTNYSSARAALLEAWRVYMLYRTWMERHLCQPVWQMVMEEAWLQGELVLPKGGPDFYDGLSEYTHASWIGPAKGHVDPLKEVKANQVLLKDGVLTMSDWAAELGKDWEAQIEQRGREVEKIRSVMPAPDPAQPAQGAQQTPEPEGQDQ